MHDELRSLLGRIRRRWFVPVALSTSGRAAAAAAIPLFASALAGWLLRPAGVALVALAVIATLAAAGGAVLVVLRMRRRPDDAQVARFVEERAAAAGLSPALSDALVSAVQVSEAPDRHAEGFGELIVANAVRVLQETEPSAIVTPDIVRRATLEAIVGFVLVVVAAVSAYPYILRASATAWVALFPRSIAITVATGDVRVPAGRPLRISAAINGRGAKLLGVVPSLVVSAGGQQRTVEMSPADGGFVYAFESVDRSFQYHVTAGAATSRSYDVTALFPPRVKRIDVRYEYPAFTRLDPREQTDGGDIFGPAGTRVRLRVQADKPLKAGSIALEEGRPVGLSPSGAGGDSATADLVLSKDNAYRVGLTDTDGLSSSGELEYFIRVMDDRPPDVRIVRPSADQGITPLEEVTIEARADDDYGVAQFELVYAVAGRSPRTVPFNRVAGTDVAKIGSHLLAAEDLRVQPGDVITYYARARDVARGKPSSETRSDIFFLEVKPFNEEFVAAQSQAMGGSMGTQIDSLIAAQKEIINATWNLERRSAAGRSSTDMKAVGQAQAELKARVEQMLSGGRRGRGGFMPPQQVGRSSQAPQRTAADPVTAAIEAMGRAVEQLQHERTADAIPHEMAALQGLLKAQSEVRRRQVMQQSASAAGQGGTSRTDRDLSALFDRELQRQQRTNYETPKPSTETSDRDGTSDALDRVRELARRQEELARRQRELANGQLSAEEMKRALERLTREQEELRQQADALEQRMQKAAGAEGGRQQSGRGSESASGGQRSSDMRDAAQQMRRAAEEMQRQNAGGAAASSEKAAEALRQLERQMRSASPDARQRASGELQLEAQQIADSQRRIASEMSRLEKDAQSGSTSDALRRLAGEKEKLADRVDELQRAARQLERDTPGAAGEPFRNAAQHLQDQQVGSRMRSSARDIRDRASGAGPQKPSQSQTQLEHQLTRTLDSLVDRLGGKNQTDARRLTDELDRVREMRDRLEKLEAQVRTAEANARAAEQSRGAQSQGAQSQRGREGQSGRQSGSGEGSPGQQLQRAREEYSRELERSRASLGRLQQDGQGGSTPEEHEFSLSAPGNESFKQDFSGWEKLRKDIDLRVERYESAVSARLARKAADDRMSAGGSQRVPDAYRDAVSRYFESLAKAKK